MEGFKSSPKMQCFKEGGSVKYKSRRSEKTEVSKDIAKDKKIVKKAFAMHDKQSHEGEKTNLSKLKNGGRMKKEGGCVGRYQAGGSIGMKKDSGDIKDIQKIKLTKTKKAKAPSKAAIKPAMSNIAEPAPDMGTMPPMMKKGKSVKKYNAGKLVTDEESARMPAGKLPQQVVDEEAMASNTETREMVAGPLRKLKQGFMEKFKSKSKTPVAPMRNGGKAC
jgi:hypothetical protein